MFIAELSLPARYLKFTEFTDKDSLYMIISFIGGGNMATALISGLIRYGTPAANIRVTDPSVEARQRLKAHWSLQTFSSVSDAVSSADVVVLAIKPQDMATVLEALDGNLQPGQLVISIAAGITLDTLTEVLGEKQPLIRCMPNAPALTGEGITAMVANGNCNTEHRFMAERILASAGFTEWIVEEGLMDAVTAVSGSGPAYFFLLSEALASAGTKMGLPKDVSVRLALHTLHGSGVLAAASDVDLAELRRRVTSPGGTTLAALEVFAAADFVGLVEKAVRAATQRGHELAHGGKDS
jgi:pyrroline-5-carboxylate reductase